MTIETRICQHCGQQYQPNSNAQKYCMECRQAADALKIKVCCQCGHEYKPRSSNQKYCPECRPIVRKGKVHAWNLAQSKGHSVKTCVRCGKQFLQNSGNQKYCAVCVPEAEVEIHKMSCAKWQRENPEKIAVKGSKRRASKYDNTPINEMLTSTEWLAILAETKGHCHYCDKEAKLTLDHVIPLSQGGKHSIDNVVPACIHCNTSKGARTPEQWLQSLTTVHSVQTVTTGIAAGLCTERRL